jgi:IS4 transposase
VNPNCKNKIVKSNTLSKAVETDTLIIYSDEQVFLYAISKRKAKNTVRLIKTRSKETNEEIWFVTSIVDGTSIDITEIYKQR